MPISNLYVTTITDNQTGESISATDLVSGGGGAATWDSITGKPAVIAAGATQALARTAIGAGTSNLAVGTLATDAKAGNYTPPLATATVAGIVKQSATQANFAGADAAAIVVELNAFLAKLKAAGISL